MNNEKTKELLSRGIQEIINKDSLIKKLKSNKKLRIKLGIDPTSPNIHIGRSIPLLKLKDFQDLGHKIIFIIGDFTGKIGDTSDKNSERPMLTDKQVKNNLKNYIKQASKIINIDNCEIYYNSQWLNGLGYSEISHQANIFSLNEFISRENISRRLDQGKRISLRELLYPLMQGYDSVKIKSDVEIGGTDQKFNMLTGRTMQRLYNQEPQDIITNPLIQGLDNRKMSSSFNNTINLADSPNDMFGKTMSLKDDLIIDYLVLTTRIDINEIKKYEKDIKKGTNPRDIKMKLAHELVRMYHSQEKADKAQKYFINTFSEKKIPSKINEFKPKLYNIVSILTESNLSLSKSEARRIIKQGGIKVNGEKIINEKHVVSPGSVLQKGKIKFLKIK